MPKFTKYLKMAFDLKDFLETPLSLQESRDTVMRRIEERETNFLNMLAKGVYQNKTSPYLKLLQAAGCELGDIESSVAAKGIEVTLRSLRESGVYLKYEEFKGREEVKRGGISFKVKQSDLNNPNVIRHLRVETGGTTGMGLSIFNGFEFYTQVAVHRAVLFDTHELWDIPFGIWYPILPSSAGIGQLLHATKIGKVPKRWFSQVDREYTRPLFKHKLRTNFLIYAGRFWGTKLPKPEFVDLNNAVRIAEWIAGSINEYSGCCLCTYPSSAVRVCHAAKKHGLDITGTKFFMAGEPLTPAKQREIASAGANAIPQYAFAEGGTVGYGCANPVHPDEVHFQKDSLAFIRYKRPLNNNVVDSFHYTSLLPSAPKILLNVEIGDYGEVESRNCGCGLEKLGFREHIYSIRSFDKLNSEGMTLNAAKLTRIIEEVLPSRYGGNSTDYQVVEEEASNGITHVKIVVSPDVGEIDEQKLLETVNGEFRKGMGNTMMSDILLQANTFRVKRAYPESTWMGKILPIHMTKKTDSG
jgi:hypothetical protein